MEVGASLVMVGMPYVCGEKTGVGTRKGDRNRVGPAFVSLVG